MKKIVCSLILLVGFQISAQKKILDHPDFDIWNRIQNPVLSAEGNFVMYSLEQGEKDSHLKIKDSQGNLIFQYERSKDGQFTYDSEIAIFNIKAWTDSITEMKRRKVKKEKLPKDSIGIYHLKNQSFQKIANVKSYKIPEKWSGFIAYLSNPTKNEIQKR